MSRKANLTFIATVLFVIIGPPVQGEIISTVFEGHVSADFDGTQITDNSTDQTATTDAHVISGSSSSQAGLNWDWVETNANGVLTGDSQLVGEMTDSGEPGGSHVLSSNFSFGFTVDTISKIEIGGSLDIVGTSALDDFVDLSLTSESGTLFSDSTVSNGGITTGSFDYTRIIEPGTYTVVFRTELTEDIDSARTSYAAWQLDGIVISEVNTVSEPALTIFVLPMMALVLARHKR